jgi:hypothetical protein
MPPREPEAARGTPGHRGAVDRDAPAPLLPLPASRPSSSRVEPFSTAAFTSSHVDRR